MLRTALVLACAFTTMAAAAGDARWTTLAPVPEARTEVSATTDGRHVYLIGGFIDGERDERGRPPVSREMLVYDPVSDRWERRGLIPEGVHHAGFVHIDGMLYIVGGYRNNTFDPTGAVRIYDIATGEWRDGAMMPTPRGAMAVAVHDGRIHAIGGTILDRAHAHEHDNPAAGDDRSVGTHEVYNPQTDRWERRAPMPTARNHHGAATVAGRIHVVAGRVGRNFEMTEHEVFDPATDTWAVAAPLPTGRGGVSVVAAKGRVYVFGGETFGDHARTFADAEAFDPRTGHWTQLAPMPTARHGLGAAAIRNAIHVVSGGPTPGYGFGTANERLEVD